MRGATKTRVKPLSRRRSRPALLTLRGWTRPLDNRFTSLVIRLSNAWLAHARASAVRSNRVSSQGTQRDHAMRSDPLVGCSAMIHCDMVVCGKD